jgi:hypothetical protein
MQKVTTREQRWIYLYQKKTYCKSKVDTRDEGHYIMIKRTIYHDPVINVNVYVPNFRTPRYIK